MYNANQILLLLLGFVMLPLGSSASSTLVGDRESILKAVGAAEPGDEIVIADGIYEDLHLRIEASGTAAAPLHIRAETPGQVRLTGQSQLSIAGDHVVVRGLQFTDGHLESASSVIRFGIPGVAMANHSRVTECAIIDYSPPWAESDDDLHRYHWVVMEGVGNRLDHCLLSGHENWGVTVAVNLGGGEAHHRIDHNFFGPRSAPPEWITHRNGYETIRIGTSTYRTLDAQVVVENNYFHRCSGEGEIISNKTNRNVYSGNVFVASNGWLTLRYGNECLVHGNLFLAHGEPGSGGVRVTGNDHQIVGNYFERTDRAALVLHNGIEEITGRTGYIRPRRTVVASNTFRNCRTTMSLGALKGRFADDLGELGPHPQIDTTFANNSFLTDGAPVVELIDEPENPRWHGNTYHGGELGMEAPERGMEHAPPVRTLNVEAMRKDLLNRVGPGWSRHLPPMIEP